MSRHYHQIKVLKICWNDGTGQKDSETIAHEKEDNRYQYCRQELNKLTDFLRTRFGFDDQYSCDLVVNEDEVSRYARLSASIEWVKARSHGHQGTQGRQLCIVVYSGRAFCDEACLPRETILLDQKNSSSTPNDSLERWHAVLREEIFSGDQDVLVITNGCHTDVEMPPPFYGFKCVLAPSAHDYLTPDSTSALSFFDVVIAACNSFVSCPFTIEALFERCYTEQVLKGLDHGPRLMRNVGRDPLMPNGSAHLSPSICLSPQNSNEITHATSAHGVPGRLDLSTNLLAPFLPQVTFHADDPWVLMVMDSNTGAKIGVRRCGDDHGWEQDEIMTNFSFAFAPSRHVNFPGFVRRPHHWFLFGRIFSVLWPDPQIRLSTIQDASFVDAEDPDSGANLRIRSMIRHFVVIQARPSHIKVLPIMSYEGRFPHPGIVKEDHGLTYANASDHQDEQEANGLSLDHELSTYALRVVPAPPLNVNAMLPLCWIDYKQPYTFSLLHSNEFSDSDEPPIDDLPGLQAKPYALVSQRSIWKLAANFADLSTLALAPRERTTRARQTFSALKREFRGDSAKVKHDDDLDI